jgi:hypothetical protein
MQLKSSLRSTILMQCDFGSTEQAVYSFSLTVLHVLCDETRHFVKNECAKMCYTETEMDPSGLAISTIWHTVP